MMTVQRLYDRHVAIRQNAEEEPYLDGRHAGAKVFQQGCWLSLGGGTFFSSMSSRSEAMQRLARTKCNVLLRIRPDEHVPCYPKHMMLHGKNVDDTLFPLDALFH